MYKFIFTCLAFLFTFILHSQINDLSQLAEGDMTNFQTIYDKEENVYGYMAVYDKGEKTKGLRLFEIFIFDYNLNTLLSQKITTKSGIYSYGCYFDKFGKLILYPYYSEKTDFTRDQFQLDLSQNKLEEYNGDCFIFDKIKPCIVEYSFSGIKNKKDNEISSKGFYEESKVYRLIDSQYIVTKSKNIKAHKQIFDKGFEILKFDKEKNLLWKYKDDSSESKDAYQSIILIHQDTSSVFYMRMNYLKSKFKNVDYISVNSKTGEKLTSLNHSSFREETYISFIALMSGNKLSYIDGRKRIKDKIHYVGAIIEDRRSQYTKIGDVGYVKMIYDIPSGQVSFQQFSFLSLKTHFPKIDKYGEIGDYDLSLVAVYPFENGNDVFIFEKFQYSLNHWTGKVKGVNDDLVMVTTDTTFTPMKINTIKKRVTKGSYSEYLYGQYLNDDKDLVFFYYDDIKKEDVKEKDYFLYVNKIINGQYSQDNFLISTKDNTVIPKIAKEGYILLREFNKEAKYNQIRLEKLNF